MQLIRLGDASNFSHGRNSASTLDDGFSGAADASSSTGATSDGGDISEGEFGDEYYSRSKHGLGSNAMASPGAVKRAHEQLDEVLPSCNGTEPSENEGDEDYPHEERAVDLIKSEYDEDVSHQSAPKAKKAKVKVASVTTSNKARGPRAAPMKPYKNGQSRSAAVPRKLKAAMMAPINPKAPMSIPATTSASFRKLSGSAVSLQHHLAADEEDLSTKPRCQRCRKSKKGCDRQRPCGRCKDAGIGLEGCISEDEGNGRRGRYGRHMGVPVKKVIEAAPMTNTTQPIGVPFVPMPSGTPFSEKSKKRKR
jgi:hypothetical protein